MRFYFRPKVTFICLTFIALTLRLSYWQWERHLEKKIIIQTLEQRLAQSIQSYEEVVSTPVSDWSSLIHRRVALQGEFDFDHEMIIKNRRYESIAGVYLLTPFKISSTGEYVLVQRGFIPLKESDKNDRFKFREKNPVTFIGLIKETQRRKMFSPKDPLVGENLPWADSWLRVNIDEIQKQLPYKVLPIFVERMDKDGTGAEDRIIKKSSDKDEILSLTGRTAIAPEDLSKYNFPIPTYETIIPITRHLGYVFEWAFMGLITFIIGIWLQFRPPKKNVLDIYGN